MLGRLFVREVHANHATRIWAYERDNVCAVYFRFTGDRSLRDSLFEHVRIWPVSSIKLVMVGFDSKNASNVGKVFESFASERPCPAVAH